MHNNTRKDFAEEYLSNKNLRRYRFENNFIITIKIM